MISTRHVPDCHSSWLIPKCRNTCVCPLSGGSTFSHKVLNKNASCIGSAPTEVLGTCSFQLEQRAVLCIMPPLDGHPVVMLVIVVYVPRRIISGFPCSTEKVVECTARENNKFCIAWQQVDTTEQNPSPGCQDAKCVFHNPPAATVDALELEHSYTSKWQVWSWKAQCPGAIGFIGKVPTTL